MEPPAICRCHGRIPHGASSIHDVSCIYTVDDFNYALTNL